MSKVKRPTSRVRTVAALVLPFIFSAVLLSPLFIRRSTEATVSVTTNSLTFQVGQLDSRRIGILLPLSHSDLRLEHVRSMDIYVGDTGSPEHLSSTDGQCSLSLSEARVATARPSPGDFMTLEWRETEPDWIHARIWKDGNDGTQATRRLTVETAGKVTELSGCTNSERVAGSQVADYGPLEVACQGDCSYSYRRVPADSLLETEVPLLGGSKVDLTRTAYGQTESGIIEPVGSLAVQGATPAVINPGFYVVLGEIQSGLIKRLTVDKGLRVTVAGKFGQLQTGPAMELLTDQRPTYWSGIARDTGFGKYSAAVLVLGAAILSGLTRLKIVEKE